MTSELIDTVTNIPKLTSFLGNFCFAYFLFVKKVEGDSQRSLWEHALCLAEWAEKKWSAIAMDSAYLFRLVHCREPLHTFSSGSPHAFYMTFLQYHQYCVFEDQPKDTFTIIIQ